MTVRKDQELHDKTCGLVAKVRFPYPDENHPDWRTIVNHPTQLIGFNNGKLIPDVVTLNQDNIAQVLGEIETDDTVNEESAKQWQDYSMVCEWLYVYVPKGYGKLAMRLGGEYVKGFREYFYENDRIEINLV